MGPFKDIFWTKFPIMHILPSQGPSGCSAFVVETEVDGNEPVRLHHQDIQVTRDEQEESNKVARTED